MLRTILIILLVLFPFGCFASGRIVHIGILSSGGAGLLLIIVIILVVMDIL